MADPVDPVRKPSASSRWVVCGALAGCLYGVGYSLLGLEVADQPVFNLSIVGGAAVIGAVVGAAFGSWYHARQPTECSLCTWLGFLLGLFPAVVVLICNIALIGSPRMLVGLVLAPAMSGLLVGGLLDRLMEPKLFSENLDEGEPS